MHAAPRQPGEVRERQHPRLRAQQPREREQPERHRRAAAQRGDRGPRGERGGGDVGVREVRELEQVRPGQHERGGEPPDRRREQQRPGPVQRGAERREAHEAQRAHRLVGALAEQRERDRDQHLERVRGRRQPYVVPRQPPVEQLPPPDELVGGVVADPRLGGERVEQRREQEHDARGGDRAAGEHGAGVSHVRPRYGPPVYRIMGVVNVTPDSFSDGGAFLDPGAAIAHGLRLAPRARNPRHRRRVDPARRRRRARRDEELRRVIPVIEGIRARGAPCGSRSTRRRPSVAARGARRRRRLRQRRHRAARRPRAWPRWSPSGAWTSA